MSRRETSLCDIPLTSYGGAAVVCGHLAISTCPLCTRDICMEHAMHPRGGFLLRADSITANATSGNMQDVIWSAGSVQIVPYPQIGMQTPMIRMNFCKGCRQALGDHAIQDALLEIKEQFVKILAAAMTAKGLSETR